MQRQIHLIQVLAEWDGAQGSAAPEDADWTLVVRAASGQRGISVTESARSGGRYPASDSSRHQSPADPAPHLYPAPPTSEIIVSPFPLPGKCLRLGFGTLNVEPLEVAQNQTFLRFPPSFLRAVALICVLDLRSHQNKRHLHHCTFVFDASFGTFPGHQVGRL